MRALATDKMIARKDGAIGWMTFNNPERRNAVSLEMWAAIPQILEDFAADPDVRVVVMNGAGDKSFVAGADISQFEERRANADAAAEYARIATAAWQALAAIDKPLVAMIRGFCIGGGLAVAMKADIRIAATDAQFAVPAARLGLAYGADSLRDLVSLVGPSEAKSILFSAARLDAEKALRLGLINQVVPIEGLEKAVRDYCALLQDNAPLTMRAAKRTIDALVRGTQDRDEALLEQLARDCFDSADYAEGRRAFMEKRRPQFRGR